MAIIFQDIAKSVQNSLLQCQSTIECLTQEFNCQVPEFVSISKKQLLAKEKKQMRLNPTKCTTVITNVVNRKVQDNSHVSINKCYYSVPYLFRGKSVDAKYWIPNRNGQNGTVEIYCDGVLIARHPLFPLDAINQYSTNSDHLPDFKHQPITNRHYWLTRAKRIGPNTEQVVFNIFRSVSFEEQAYISARSIITTANKFDNLKWEKACSLALEHYRVPKSRQIKEYLQ